MRQETATGTPISFNRERDIFATSQEGRTELEVIEHLPNEATRRGAAGESQHGKRQPRKRSAETGLRRTHGDGEGAGA